MTSPDADEVARARAAVTRIRISQALGRRRWVADAGQLLVFVLPGALALAVMLLTEHYDRHRYVRDAFDNSGILLSLALCGLGSLCLDMIAVTMAGAMAMVFVPFAALALPFEIAGWIQQRRVEDRLLREGRVEKGEAGRAVLHDVASADDGLIVDRGGTLRPVADGPPAVCSGCGGVLRSISPGYRKCENCGQERFDDLPARPKALDDARSRLELDDDAPAYSRRALWRWFLKNHSPEYQKKRRTAWIGFAIMFGCGVIADFGQLIGVKAIMGIGLVGLSLMTVGIAFMFAAAAWYWYEARFVRFRPGMLAYDRALAAEIVTATANQGRIGLDDLAVHLGVSRFHLDAVLQQLAHVRELPLYRDPKHDALISLHAEAIRDACPACGGHLEVAPHRRIVCPYCGGSMLAV